MRNRMLDHKRNIVRKKILVVLSLALYTMMSSSAVAYAQQQQQQDVRLPIAVHLQQTPPPASPTPSKHHKHHKSSGSAATPPPASSTPTEHHKSSGSAVASPSVSPTPTEHHKSLDVSLQQTPPPAASPTPSENPGQHEPSGNAKLRWNPRSQELTVTLQVSGLQPGSSHAAHIHAGACSAVGKILHPFQDIVADKAGNATLTTTIYKQVGGIPPTGWNITVHKGATTETGTLLCGDVVNPHRLLTASVPLQPPSASAMKT